MYVLVVLVGYVDVFALVAGYIDVSSVVGNSSVSVIPGLSLAG